MQRRVQHHRRLGERVGRRVERPAGEQEIGRLVLVAVVGVGRVCELAADSQNVLGPQSARHDEVAVGLEAVPLRLGQPGQRSSTTYHLIMS